VCSNVDPFNPGADSSCDPAVLPFERVPRDVTVAATAAAASDFSVVVL
jgi:hypothetical protein